MITVSGFRCTYFYYKHILKSNISEVKKKRNIHKTIKKKKTITHKFRIIITNSDVCYFSCSLTVSICQGGYTPEDSRESRIERESTFDLIR